MFPHPCCKQCSEHKVGSDVCSYSNTLVLFTPSISAVEGGRPRGFVDKPFVKPRVFVNPLLNATHHHSGPRFICPQSVMTSRVWLPPFRHNTFSNHHITCGGIVTIPLQHLNCLADLSQDSRVFLHFLGRFRCFCHNFQILKQISVRIAIFPRHTEFQPVVGSEDGHFPHNVNWVGRTSSIESGALPNLHFLPYINIPLTNFLEGPLPYF